MATGQSILSSPTWSFSASHQYAVGMIGTENKHANSYFRSLSSQQARRHDEVISVTSPRGRKRAETCDVMYSTKNIVTLKSFHVLKNNVFLNNNNKSVFFPPLNFKKKNKMEGTTLYM